MPKVLGESSGVAVTLPVLTKQQNFDLWASGAYGNKLRQWRDVDEWQASGFGGLVVLRYLGAAGGGLCRYNLLPREVWPTVVQWVDRGAVEHLIMVNEAAPDQHVVLQGELLNSGYLNGYFFYSTAKAHMRPALEAEPQHACGLRTRMLLKAAMTPSSYADLIELEQQYPEHAIELSIYSCCLGDIPGRNTLVWECRRY